MISIAAPCQSSRKRSIHDGPTAHQIGSKYVTDTLSGGWFDGEREQSFLEPAESNKTGVRII